MKRKCMLLVVMMSVLLNGAANGKESGKPQIIAAENIYGSHVSFTSKVVARNTTLSVIGPSGFHARKSTDNGIPSIDLHNYGALKDGLYNYEITTAVGKTLLIKDTLNNGRGENNSHYARKGVTQTGHFRVVGGQIKRYKQFKEPSAKRGF